MVLHTSNMVQPTYSSIGGILPKIILKIRFSKGVIWEVLSKNPLNFSYIHVLRGDILILKLKIL